MTGSTPHLCDEIGVIDLDLLQPRNEDVGEVWRSVEAVQAYSLSVTVVPMDERVVLSAKWSRDGNFILVNTRPFVEAVRRGKGTANIGPPRPMGSGGDDRT